MANQSDDQIISRLKKLAELYKSGILTKEEFEEQKRRILDNEIHTTESPAQKVTKGAPVTRIVSGKQTEIIPATPPKYAKRRNKRIVVIAIIAVVIIAAAITIPLSVSHKREAESQQLELARLDSIQREEARLEALRIEEARLDSIRQDSIENRLRTLEAFSPTVFLKRIKYDEHSESVEFKKNIPTVIKNLGFSQSKKQFVKELICYNCGDEDQGFYPGYVVEYENKNLGIKVEWTYEADETESDINNVNGITLIFMDTELENIFLSKLLKMGYTKKNNEYYPYGDTAYGLCLIKTGNKCKISLLW